MSKKNTNENSPTNENLHYGENIEAYELANAAAQFGYVAGAQEARRNGAGEEVFEQADRDTPLSVGGHIDAWFDRIVSGLPQEQIAVLKEQVKKYLFQKESSGDEKSANAELTGDELIKNAKSLIKNVMEKFDADGEQSSIRNFSLMIFLHKLIAAELGKHVSFFEIGKLYLSVFTHFLFQFLTGLSPKELQKVLDVTLRADALSFRKCCAAVVLAISCMYLYNNYFKEK